MPTTFLMAADEIEYNGKYRESHKKRLVSCGFLYFYTLFRRLGLYQRLNLHRSHLWLWFSAAVPQERYGRIHQYLRIRRHQHLAL